MNKGEVPLVSVVFAVPGGVRYETLEKSGVSNLTASMLLKGTMTRSEEDVLLWPRLDDCRLLDVLFQLGVNT